MRLRDRLQLKSILIARIKTEQTPEDKALQDSLVEAEGQKYPIKVRPIDHPDYDYEIVNGRQRINALLAVGGTEVLALVEAMDDVELHLQALIGNANKPNEIDEARHIIELEQRGLTGDQIAKITRYSKATISQRKRLIEKLHPLAQTKLQTGEIKVSTALQATKLPLDEQENMFGNDHNPSYKEVFEAVRTWETAQLAFDLETVSEIKPGLFLTYQQVEDLINGQNIEVEYLGEVLTITKNT